MRAVLASMNEIGRPSLEALVRQVVVPPLDAA